MLQCKKGKVIKKYIVKSIGAYQRMQLNNFCNAIKSQIDIILLNMYVYSNKHILLPFIFCFVLISLWIWKKKY